MRLPVAAIALSRVLLCVPVFAQAGQAPAPPAAPAQEAKPPVQAPAPTQPAPPPRGFRDGLRYAFIDVQAIAAQSVEGKALAERIKALNDQKVKELNEKNRALQAAQQKLEQSGGVLSDQARQQLQTEIERQQRDIQRFTEDAQEEVARLQQQLEAEFRNKLNPVLDRVAREKQLHFILSVADSGLVWADVTAMDLTQDVIKALDAAAGAKPGAK
jgi:outer membrane protein